MREEELTTDNRTHPTRTSDMGITRKYYKEPRGWGEVQVGGDICTAMAGSS